MFEKKQTKIDDISDVVETTIGLDAALSEATDYGMFAAAQIAIEGDELVISLPLRHGITTVRAHKAILAAWATDNVAGKLLDEAKKFKP